MSEKVSSQMVHEDALRIVRSARKKIVQDLMDDPGDAVYDSLAGWAPTLNRLPRKGRAHIQDALPYEEIVERGRSFTNMRVVPDDASDMGYRIEVGSFPG